LDIQSAVEETLQLIYARGFLSSHNSFISLLFSSLLFSGEEASGGMIAIDRHGNCASAFTTPDMAFCGPNLTKIDLIDHVLGEEEAEEE